MLCFNFGDIAFLVPPTRTICNAAGILPQLGWFMQASLKPDSLNIVTGKKMSDPHRPKNESSLLLYYQDIINQPSVNYKFRINISNATDMPHYQTVTKCYERKFLRALLLLIPNRCSPQLQAMGGAGPPSSGHVGQPACTQETRVLWLP